VSRAKQRVALGACLGVAATLAAWLIAHRSGAVLAGGLVGTLLGAAFTGAQVVLVERAPKSNASFLAMVVGFFAKGSALVVGILLLNADPAGQPIAFALAFLGALALVSIVVFSALVPRGQP